MGESVHSVMKSNMPSVALGSSRTTAYGGNLSGNLQAPTITFDNSDAGRPREVLRLRRERSAWARRFARNGDCEPGANLPAASDAKCVPIVRTGLRTCAGDLAPT
jgi:hypothetical protein